MATGVAAAEAIKAGDEGGKKAVLMGAGFIVGIIGAFFKVPMSAFGVAFIGNIWALSMFGVGLLLRGYSPQLFGGVLPDGDLMAAYIPHGFMIGAGLVALFQVIALFVHRDKGSVETSRSAATSNKRSAPGAWVGCCTLYRNRNSHCIDWWADRRDVVRYAADFCPLCCNSRLCSRVDCRLGSYAFRVVSGLRGCINYLDHRHVNWLSCTGTCPFGRIFGRHGAGLC